MVSVNRDGYEDDLSGNFGWDSINLYVNEYGSGDYRRKIVVDSNIKAATAVIVIDEDYPDGLQVIATSYTTDSISSNIQVDSNAAHWEKTLLHSGLDAPSDVEAADMTNDGKDDIVVASYLASNDYTDGVENAFYRS